MGCIMDRKNNKIGYLDDNFKIFHIRDKKDITFGNSKYRKEKTKIDVFESVVPGTG